MNRIAPALHAFSWIVMGFAFTLLVPMAWALAESWQGVLVWAGCLLFTLICGLLLHRKTRRFKRELTVRDGFLLVNMVWIVLPAFAALPLLISVMGMGWSKAYFEAMSGLTATGATVLSGLDLLPTSVNVWRCFLQLLGGLGIMLLAIAVLPFLGLGGIQIYKAEVPGPISMKETRLTPRIADTARGLWSVYFVLSLACFICYRIGGMSWSDAFMHMCTTVGLGGLSSHDKSFAYWNSPQLEWTAVVFMALSGISFLRYFLVWRTRSMAPLARDAEVRAYATVLLMTTLIVGLMLFFTRVYPDYSDAIRTAAFQVVSVATTTGYATTDYAMWPAFAPVLLLFLGCFISCTFSTGGGMKMVRMLIMIRIAQRELLRIVHPRVVHPIRLGDTIIRADQESDVIAYMVVYGGVMVLLTMLMLISPTDLVSSFSAVVAAVNNIGPGLGQVGPTGNYGALGTHQLWLLSAAMLVGRLEFLPVLVLLTPQFWRR